MNDEWTFDSEPNETVKFADVAPETVALIRPDRRECICLYSNGQQVGEFDFSNGIMKFSGNMDESAAAFLLVVKQLFEHLDPPDMV